MLRHLFRYQSAGRQRQTWAAIVLRHVDVVQPHLLDDPLEPVELAWRKLDRVGVQVTFERLHFLTYKPSHGLRDHPLLFGH